MGTPSLGAGRWGQFDLAGDVWEWTLDWAASTFVDPSVDGAYLQSGGSYGRGIRGGVYSYSKETLLATDGSGETPWHNDGGLGFRCARTP